MPTKTFFRSLAFESGPRDQLRFAGPRATSQWVALPVMALLSLNASSLTPDETAETFLIHVSGALVGFIAAWCIFLILGKIIRIGLPNPGKKREIGVVALYALTEIVRTSTGWAVVNGIGHHEDADWGYRITAAALTGIVFFGIASTMVNDSFVYQETYRGLAERKLQLQATLETSKSALISTRERLISRVREELNIALRSSIAESARRNPRLVIMTENLFSAIDNVVRPVSHELFSNPSIFEHQSSVTVVPSPRVSLVLSEATRKQPVKPFGFALIAVLLTLPIIIFKSDSATFVSRYIVASIALIVVLVLSRELFRVVGHQLNFAAGLLLLVVSYALASACYTAIFAVELPGVNANSWLILLYGALIGAALGLFLALISGMHEARAVMLDELESVNTRLSWMNARLQSELWAEQKRLAMSLHNNVQGLLLAAALKLRSVTDKPVSTAELGQVRELVQQAVDFQIAADDPMSITEALDQLRTNWEDLVSITWDIDPTVVKAVDSDAIGANTLVEIFTEFTTNAIKHGGASNISLRVSRHGDREVAVEMTNDGLPLPEKPSEGMGTSFMKSVSTTSSVMQMENGFGVRLMLPIASLVDSSFH